MQRLVGLVPIILLINLFNGFIGPPSSKNVTFCTTKRNNKWKENSHTALTPLPQYIKYKCHLYMIIKLSIGSKPPKFGRKPQILVAFLKENRVGTCYIFLHIIYKWESQLCVVVKVPGWKPRGHEFQFSRRYKLTDLGLSQPWERDNGKPKK